ncbi:hypothetical protein T492DRAFT_60685 [Pavlovales sp. CCMP2436]|nr:hypothetical protein T492DRAFT_60685 [Pavlovales sp. CCMP2436]
MQSPWTESKLGLSTATEFSSGGIEMLRWMQNCCRESTDAAAVSMFSRSMPPQQRPVSFSIAGDHHAVGRIVHFDETLTNFDHDLVAHCKVRLHSGEHVVDDGRVLGCVLVHQVLLQGSRRGLGRSHARTSRGCHATHRRACTGSTLART